MCLQVKTSFDGAMGNETEHRTSAADLCLGLLLLLLLPLPLFLWWQEGRAGEALMVVRYVQSI